MFFRKKKDPLQEELEQMRRESEARQSQPTANWQTTQSTASWDNRPSSSGSFRMIVEDIFSITGRGTVLTGQIESGQIRVGDTVLINNNLRGKITGVEAFRRTLTEAQAGEKVGLLINLNRNQISRGDVITK
ncbi:MAG: EF-Tu/IF-2/RF-3 family GTPase [Firmicutes bacterium]|nr:EF-Tu/IF-2/RF-3 family GTPase [Bacillota bacterium]